MLIHSFVLFIFFKKYPIIDFYKKLDFGFDEIDLEKSPFDTKDFTKLLNEEFTKQYERLYQT